MQELHTMKRRVAPLKKSVTFSNKTDDYETTV